MTTVLEPASAAIASTATAVPATAPAAASADPLVRVVKGTLADEELAALTAVLLARAAVAPSMTATGAAGTGGAQAQWQRPERHPSYNSPVSWHR